MRRTIRSGRTISRRACARRLDRCESVCACAAPQRALRLGLLRLRADVHFAFLRRAADGRLRSVQFRNAGHRKAVRGHPRGGLQARRPRQVRRDRRHQSLRADGVGRAAASCCRRRSTAFASSASTCRASACRPMPRPRMCLPAAMLKFARQEAEQGPVQAPRGRPIREADRDAARRNVSGRSRADRRDAGADGPRRGAGRSDPRMARALRRARLRGRRRHPSLLHGERARIRAGRPADRRLRARSAWKARPPGSKRSATRAAFRARRSTPRRPSSFPAIKAALAQTPIQGRVTLSGYEGSELLVARLLIESGADVPLCRHRLPADAIVGSRSRVARGQGRQRPVPRLARAGSRGDASNTSPISRSARRPWCRRPRSAAIPALYFTNLISARPLMGVAGAGSLAQGHQRRDGQQGPL